VHHITETTKTSPSFVGAKATQLQKQQKHHNLFWGAWTLTVVAITLTISKWDHHRIHPMNNKQL